MVCTFFGHRDCYGLNEDQVYHAIENLIHKGVDKFYVGNQGSFDGMVRRCLKMLTAVYPHIQYAMVMAYLPGQKREFEDLSDGIYPEIEGHPKFAIDRRNRWMIAKADCCLCYITHTWGGAYKYACIAKRRGLQIVNLGDVVI